MRVIRDWATSRSCAWLGAALLAAALSIVTGCAPRAGNAGAAALPVTDHPLSGAPAPEFQLAARGGEPASLSAYAGRVILLDFWATWCEPCRSSFPEYQALLGRYGDAVAVVAISEDDEANGIDAFVAETGARFPIAWDSDKSVAQRYQISSMPTLFIIDKGGLVRFVHAGFRAGDQDQITAAIDSLL
jgi:peroxiredoxin